MRKRGTGDIVSLEEQHENFVAAVKKKVNETDTYDISSIKSVTKGLFTWRLGTPG